MADKQDIAMNQFQMVTDAPYIYVELADGSQGKIKKSDLLSSVLSGNIGGKYKLPIIKQFIHSTFSALSSAP